MNHIKLNYGNSDIVLLSHSVPSKLENTSIRYYSEIKSKTKLKSTGFLYLVFKSATEFSEIKSILEKAELEINEVLDDYSFIVRTKVKDVVNIASELQCLASIKIAEPDFKHVLNECEFKLPIDDLLDKQWYLNNEGKDPLGDNNWKLRKGADAKVFEAWEILEKVTGSFGSDTITIAVLDKGFDLKHPDFEGKLVSPKDFSSLAQIEPFKIFEKESPDTNTLYTNADHGTACAGIALAKSNGVGIVGVAPEAKFMPIVYNTGGGRDLRKMFRHIMRNGGDVLSCSFGNMGVPMDSLAIRAVKECATKGRNGKGCVIVFATGNDYSFLKNNELTTHPNVIAVGATTSEDTFAPYTNRTTSMSVCAPGGWGHTGTMTTADPGHLNRHGILTPIGHGSTSSADDPGFIDHHHFYRFNAEGTSFACPIVAGVAALVLSADPNLTAAEVKKIIEETADKIGDASEYTRGHSPKFGFGRVNAANAVRRAFNMPLKLYPPSQQPDTSFVKPFKHDYGIDINGEIKMHESFVLFKFIPTMQHVGKRLLLTLNVPVDHDISQLLTIFIKHGNEPTRMLGGYDFQAQLTEDMMTQLVIDTILPGEYFMKIMNFSMSNFDFIKGGGEFTLNLTIDNNSSAGVFADIGFDSNDIVRV